MLRPLLDRAAIAKLAQGVPQTIAVLEKIVSDVAGTPSTIEEANTLAGSALAVAQASIAALTALAETLAQMESAPAAQPHIEADDTTPRIYLGTISAQDADQVEITGGAVDGTTVGQVAPAAGRFTDLSSTGKFGCNGAAAQAPVSLGAAATDLATTITLVNKIRAALIANGIGA